MSTRYHSSGSICPRPSFCVSLSLSFPLTVFLFLSFTDSSSPLHSLSRFARFFLRRFYAAAASSSPSLVSFLTLGERVLSSLPSLLAAPFPTPRSLATAASVHVLRPSGCFPRPLSLSFYPPFSTAYRVSIRLRLARAPYLLSRTGSPVLALAVGALLRGALLSLFLPLWHR